MAVSKRKAISKTKRFEILKRDRFTCRYCGAKAPEVFLEIEHIVPVAKGGTDDFENLVAACTGCNSGKGARLLDDHNAIAKSRDLLEKSQAEIEQLEELIRWRKTVTNKKRKQSEFVVSSLEEIANTSFTDYGRKNILNAYKKHGFDLCADYIAEYLDDDERRGENEQQSYPFTSFITMRQKRNTLEGKKKYFLGIVRNRVSVEDANAAAGFLPYLDITPGEMEELIEELKSLKAFSPRLDSNTFVDWFHHKYQTITGRDSCCDYHSDAVEEAEIPF